MYPGGQDLLIGGLPPETSSSSASGQGLGLLRLHSTYRHDLKIYASDEGRVQMTAAAFAKGLLALEGELTPILVQMVKSANTNGLLDNDPDASKYDTINKVKSKLHNILQKDSDFDESDEEDLNPEHKISVDNAMKYIGNPVRTSQNVYNLIKELNSLILLVQEEKGGRQILYHSETWDLMARRWSKLEKDFLPKTGVFDISKIPDIYDCIKYDVQHNRSILYGGPAWDTALKLYTLVKHLADVVIPQEYGITKEEKITIAQGKIHIS